MIGINDDSLASIEFRLNWEKNGVHHTDAVYAQRVNFWRDLFPESLRRELMGSFAGDTLSQSFEPGDLVALPDERQRHLVPHSRVVGQRADGSPLTPSYGRFYPRGILRGVPGVFRGNRRRVVGQPISVPSARHTEYRSAETENAEQRLGAAGTASPTEQPT